MKCEEFKEKLFNYPDVDGEFYNHLQICSSCREEFNDWIKIEEILKIPILQKEIDSEWEEIYKKIDKNITFKKYKRLIFLSILTFFGSLLPIIFFIFVYHTLNLPLIFLGISIILKEISNSSYPLIVTVIALIAVENELRSRNIN